MRISLFVAAAVLCSSAAAHADTFYFSYTGTDVTASGTLTGDQTSQGIYKITGITGTRNGDMISGLSDTDAFADQLLYFPATDTGNALNPTFLDNDGIAFLADNVDYDIFTSITRPAVVENDFGPVIDLAVSRTPLVAATPEPSSLLLLGTGVLGAAGAVKRHFA